jgi:hypothetical protein
MLCKTILFTSLILASATLAVVGCNKPQSSAVPGAPHNDADPKGGDHKDGDHKNGDHKDAEAHGHKPGAHGGVIVSLGKDSYHAEAVFEKDGTVRLYLLAKDEVKSQEIEAQELTAYVTPDGAKDPVQVKFAAERQKADAAGKTSLFAAKLPTELQGKKLKVTINNIQVGADRFRIEFSNDKNEKEGHGH